MIRFSSTALVLLSALASSLSADDSLFPLAEMRERLRDEGTVMGEWRTVVRGSEIETFELRIIGISENFAGPQSPVYIAEAVDTANVLSGPVGGMSGSPVYVDGRLVGAYAYGYLWPKEQAIIGITPIEQMLEIREDYPLRVAQQDRSSPTALAINSGESSEWSRLAPVHAPLTTGGFSARTLETFADELAELGVRPVQGPGSGSASASRVDWDTDLQPGSAVAGVLMHGDFSMAGTGTVTWRKGDEILAFGHPFFQWGEVDMPMATADVLTVVRTVNRSFKLSNTGPIVGKVSQDRLTAIGGVLGQASPMIDYALTVETAVGEEKPYTGRMFIHPSMSPVLAAMAAIESTASTLDGSLEETFEVKTRLAFATERAPLELTDRYSGPGSRIQLAMDLMQRLRLLMNNAFEPAEMAAIELRVVQREGYDLQFLTAAALEGSRRVDVGDKLSLALTLRDYQGATRRQVIEIPVPETAAGQVVEVLVADADTINQGKGLARLPRRDFDSLDDLVAGLREQVAPTQIYLQLLGRQPGIQVDGQNLEGLPPSMRSLFKADTTATLTQPTRNVVLWEGAIPVSGVFSGSYRLSLRVDD